MEPMAEAECVSPKEEGEAPGEVEAAAAEEPPQEAGKVKKGKKRGEGEAEASSEPTEVRGRRGQAGA